VRLQLGVATATRRLRSKPAAHPQRSHQLYHKGH
jgi:hypothetical protein